MALNIRDTLDILKRAGFGPDDTMKSPDPKQRLQESLERLQVNQTREQPSFTFRSEQENQTQETIKRHRNPETLTLDELLEIHDL